MLNALSLLHKFIIFRFNFIYERNGIDIINPETSKPIEGLKSKKAAKKAFYLTLITRTLIPVPGLSFILK